MQLGLTYRTIRQTYCGNPFQLSPTPSSVPFAKQRSNADAGPPAIVSVSEMLPTISKCMGVTCVFSGQRRLFFANSSSALNLASAAKSKGVARVATNSRIPSSATLLLIVRFSSLSVACDQRHRLGTRARVFAETAEHRRSYRLRAGLFYAAQSHARVFGLDNHHHPECA